MPSHLHEDHFNPSDFLTVGAEQYVKGERIVYLDTKDGVYRRHIMHEGSLVLQYWDGTEWKTA